MKCIIPEISWHNRDPVLSIDIQSIKNVEECWRLATGGSDSHVLIWHLNLTVCGSEVKCVTDLERHQKAVNVVRFSPSGEFLASGDDESLIIIWKQKEAAEAKSSENMEKEMWTSLKVLRGHMEDVLDLCWSPNSNFLVSGSVDNTAILWDVQKGRSIHIFSEAKGFVQGVTWDPRNQYVCTVSTDRQFRLYDLKTKKTVRRIGRGTVPTPPEHSLQGKTVRLFHDDTFKSFFRRLTFTVDGSLILATSGFLEVREGSSNNVGIDSTIVFSRNNFDEPVMILPSPNENTIAVRCCPMYFKIREDGPTPLVPLPYRLVFAVATKRSIVIYDTQQSTPVSVVTNIHYTKLTDIAWSADGTVLVASSTDGYCSIVSFHKGELGEEYKANESTSSNPETSEDQSKENKQNEPCFPAKWSNVVVQLEDIKLSTNEAAKSDSAEAAKKTPPKDTVPTELKKTPRRVNLITLSSPKQTKKK